MQWGAESATDEEIMSAIETAQALDVIKAKDGGLDEKVEQGGKNFSGGQRQRLTIARALVKKPEILILDDSASALDYATDANFKKVFKGLTIRPHGVHCFATHFVYYARGQKLSFSTAAGRWGSARTTSF